MTTIMKSMTGFTLGKSWMEELLGNSSAVHCFVADMTLALLLA